MKRPSRYLKFRFRPTDVSGGGPAGEAAPTAAGKAEEGSDIEVIPAEQSVDDLYFEDDPMELSMDGK